MPRLRKGFWIYLPVAVLAWFAPATVVYADFQPGLNAIGYRINQVNPVRSDSVYPTCGSEVENNINRNFDGEPFAQCGTDLLMVHYTGFITIPENTSVRFMVAADDGGTVNIGGYNMGTWNLKGCSWSQQINPPLSGGTYPLDGWFYEWTGGSCFMLAWNLNNTGWAIVPDEAFTQTPVSTTTTTTTTTTTSTTTTTTTTIPETTTTQETTTSTSSTTTSTTEPATTTTVEETTTTESTTTTSTVPEETTTTTTQPPSPPSATTTTTIQEWAPPSPEPTAPPTTVEEEPTTSIADEPQEETTIPEPEQSTVHEPETTVPEVQETYPDTTVPTEEQQPIVEDPQPPVEDIATAEEITQQVDAVVEQLTTIDEVTDEVLAEVLDVLESGTLSKDQVQEVIDAVLQSDITSDQATQLATSASVIQNVTADQAAEIFASIDTGELTSEEAAAIVAAVQDAPQEVREAFEEEINIFEGGFDEYVPTGSVISVGARRVLVAATTVSFILPAPVVSSRRQRV